MVIVGFALAAAVGHALRLPFPYVPPSARLLAALVAGAVLGPRRGAAAMGLYALGYLAVALLVAVPWAHLRAVQWALALPPDLGYALGLPACAAIVGCLAGPDRKPARARLLAAGAQGLLAADAIGVALLAWLLPPRLPEPLAPGGLLRVGLLFPLPWDLAQVAVAVWLVPYLRRRAPWLAFTEKSL
jgi:biotin transport system substrate-specific component